MKRKQSFFEGVLTNNIVIKKKIGLDGSVTYVFNPNYVKLCRYVIDNNDISVMNENQKTFFNKYIAEMDKKLNGEKVEDIYDQFDEYLDSSRG